MLHGYGAIIREEYIASEWVHERSSLELNQVFNKYFILHVTMKKISSGLFALYLEFHIILHASKL